MTARVTLLVSWANPGVAARSSDAVLAQQSSKVSFLCSLAEVMWDQPTAS